jgi:thiol-disulfide isomerase/thioredoxin
MRKSLVLVGFVLVAAWLVLPAAAQAQAGGQAVVRAVLFYSPSCGHCHYVIDEVLLPMLDQYGDRLEIIGIDVTQPAGSDLYRVAVERFMIAEERLGVPTLLVGDTVLVGSEEIPELFPRLVEAGLKSGGIGWPDLPGLAGTSPSAVDPEPRPSPTAQKTTGAQKPTAPNVSASAQPVYLAYFFDPACLACARVQADLEQLQAQYPALVVREFNVYEETVLNEALCEKYEVPEADRLLAPAIFIGQHWLGPEDITVARLQTLIEDPATAEAPPPWAELGTAQTGAMAQIVSRFNTFGVLAVAGAGLLDGINPCAFTTIIFFVSYLAVAGRQGREILLVGSAFTVAVFLTYLATGLGLAEIVRQIGSFALIGRIIYGLTAVICLALAVVSLVDYVKIRRGQLTEIALQLPQALKKRIRGTIRNRSRINGYLGAAFGTGVLVSVFELACTGQVYLPTIVFVTGVSELRWTAMAYLVLYNVMFVVPLIAVFAVAYLGTSSRQLAATFRDHAGTVKLLTAVLLGALGIWLGYLVLRP